MQTTAADLHDHVTRLNGQPYRSYKALAGSYAFDTFTLHIDHVQGDPFAAPSRVRARVAQSIAQIPRELFRDPVRRMAIEDFLARAVSAAVTRVARGQRGSGGGGGNETSSTFWTSLYPVFG
ncbi:MAG: hypothetical protein IH969_04600 [Candidatus Krumholzibacteriota bacterium]|nr:hypothetical protein [Candidatus Krumholzibacteriota bacterium]